MRIIIVYLLSFVLLLSCGKDEKEIIPPPSGNTWDYLLDTVSLGGVPLSLIKTTINRSGYTQFNKYLQHSIRLYKVTYRTTYKDEPVIASGVIAYPPYETDSIPTVIVGNGLVFADEDAPSSFDLPDNFTGFEFIASLGYYTLIPDMIGFGASKDLVFPIHNYEHSARTMIDFIHAGEEFRASKKLCVSNKKLLTGYSQGAYIALSALKMIEEDTALGIKIDATAVGAGGFNLVSLLDHVLAQNTYSAPSHLTLLFSSYNIIYDWNRPLTDFFQEPFAGEIPDLLSGQFNREEIDAHLAYSLDSLLNKEFLDDLKNHDDTEFLKALEANSIHDWAPKTPLRVIHSLNDDRIPMSDSEEMVKTMIANGAQYVRFTPITTEGHINSGLEFVELAFNWFNIYKH